VARYLLGRVASLLLSMLLLSAIVFTLMHMVPGGPFVFEKQMPDYAMDNIMRKYGLDQPVWRQYLNWVWAALHGDFGIPFESPTETVTGLILRAWPVTLRVGLLTITIAYVFGLLLGVVAAVKQNTWIDNLLTFTATLGITLPNWVIGFILIAILAVGLRLLPTGGCCEPKQFIMPVIAYALAPMSNIARFSRASTLEVMRTEYVTMARARGLPPWRVLRRYVLRTALIPLITILGPSIPDILTGSIFIETTFGLPGLGSYFTTASLHRDYPLIMALVILVGFLWGILYLASDILYTVVYPRVRLEGLGR